MAGTRADAAASSAAATGSRLLLDDADDTAERAPREEDEGNADRQQRDDVGFEAQVIALAHIRAERDGPAAPRPAAFASLVGSAAEARPGQRHGAPADAVDVLLL